MVGNEKLFQFQQNAMCIFLEPSDIIIGPLKKTYSGAYIGVPDRHCLHQTLSVSLKIGSYYAFMHAANHETR